MADDPAPGEPSRPRPSPTPRRPPHAVVVGAGPDGVAAALVLARLVERVTLVDAADVPGPEWQDGPGGRRRSDAVRRVLESPQVVVRAGLRVTGLRIVADRVTGVLVRSRRAAPGPPDLLDADLVVDARARRGDRTAARTAAPVGLLRIERPARVPSPASGRDARDAARRATGLERAVLDLLARGRAAGGAPGAPGSEASPPPDAAAG